MIEKIWRISVVAFIAVIFGSVASMSPQDPDTFRYTGMIACGLGPILRHYLLGAWRDY